MGEGSAGVVWMVASGFRVLDVGDDGIEIVVEVEIVPGVVGCPVCGVVAASKDRRWVTLRDGC